MKFPRIRSVLTAAAAALVLVTASAPAHAAPAFGSNNPTQIRGIASTDGNAGASGTIYWDDPGKYHATFSTSDFAPDGHGPELFVITYRNSKAGYVEHIDLYHHQTNGSGRSDVGLKSSADVGWNGNGTPSIDEVVVKICNGGSEAGGGDKCNRYSYTNYYN